MCSKILENILGFAGLGCYYPFAIVVTLLCSTLKFAASVELRNYPHVYMAIHSTSNDFIALNSCLMLFAFSGSV